jgi:uncharacterized protein
MPPEITLQKEIIQQLNLIPHPEGGYYSRTFTSDIMLKGTKRPVATSIYYLLEAGDVSRLHRLQSDELWFFHLGNTLKIHTFHPKKGYETILLGSNFLAGEHWQCGIPAGTIFGAEVVASEGFGLVSCAVAPGFTFEEFELIKAKTLVVDFPEHRNIIQRLTL